MTLRLATLADLEGIGALLYRMVAEIGFAKPDHAKGRGVVVGIIERGLAFVVEKDGRLAATLGLYLDSWWFSTEPFIRDQWLYVAPEHRRTRAAYLLVQEAKRVSDRVGLPLMMGVTTAKDTERKNALFRRSLTAVGETFMHFPKEQAMITTEERA